MPDGHFCQAVVLRLGRGPSAGRWSGAVSFDRRPGPDGMRATGTTFVIADVTTTDAAGAIARDAMTGASSPAAGDMLELSALTWVEQKRRLGEPTYPELLGVGWIQGLTGA